MKKKTLTNYAGMNNLTAYESLTDRRAIVDIEAVGFRSSEVTFTTKSDGTVIVKGKLDHNNPEYDADGNLDKFGHNAAREPFEVQFQLNTSKYNMSTVKVDTTYGRVRVEAYRWGEYPKSPKTYLKGNWKSPVVKAYGSYDCPMRKKTSSVTYNASLKRTCFCTYFHYAPAYVYVPAAHTLRASAQSGAHAIQ